MHNLGRWRAAVPLLVALALLAVPSSGHAAFMLTLAEGTNTASVSDNGTGTITFSGTNAPNGQGDFNILGLTATLTTSNGNPTINLSVTSVSGASSIPALSTATLTMTLSDSGLTAPAAGTQMTTVANAMRVGDQHVRRLEFLDALERRARREHIARIRERRQARRARYRKRRTPGGIEQRFARIGGRRQDAAAIRAAAPRQLLPHIVTENARGHFGLRDSQCADKIDRPAQCAQRSQGDDRGSRIAARKRRGGRNARPRSGSRF